MSDEVDDVERRMLDLFDACQRFNELPQLIQVSILSQLAEVNTEAVHHYVHGYKKHGRTFRDCDLKTCQLAVLILDKMTYSEAQQ